MERTTHAALSVALSFLFCLGLRPAVAAQADPSGPHRFVFKQRIELKQDLGRVAVELPPAALELVLREGFPAQGVSAERVERHAVAGWVLLNVQPLDAARMEALVNTLSLRPDVRFASPVFVDDYGGPMFVTPGVLAAFAGGVGPEARAALADAEGLVVEKEFAALGITLLRSTARTGHAVLDAANALAQHPSLVLAEPDMIFTGRGDLVPNDPFFATTWGLLNTGQSGGTAGVDMKATQAWDFTLGSATIKTVIIDTGVEQTHPDIMQVAGADFTSDASTTGDPVNSFDNHGTAVAGCVSATINNALGAMGVAPGTRSASARCMITVNSSGGWNSQASWTVNALNWATTISARVTNNSNGYGFTSAAIETAYISTRNAGMVHFAAAGNDAQNALGYPSSLASVNAVSAVARTGALASFSNFNAGLSVSAPGAEINTTDRTGAAGYNAADYVSINGTSFASPYAAGVAALLLSADPTLTAPEVEQLLETTATDLGTAGFDNSFGFGMVNAYAALKALLMPNDNACDAIALAVGTNGPFSNVSATIQIGEPTPPLGVCVSQTAWCVGGGAANNSVWFAFVAPASGRVSLNFGSTATWDSQLALWSAPNCAAILSGGATLVAANDDITGSTPYHAAILPVCVTPGVVYYVQVDGYGSITSPSFQLVLVEEPSALSASLSGSAAAVCSGGNANITCTGTSGATVAWSVNGGAPLIGFLSGGSFVANTGAITTSTTYDLLSVSLGGCIRYYADQAPTDLVTVGVIPLPVLASVTAAPATVCPGGDAQLAAVVGGPYCTSGLYFYGCDYGDNIENVIFANLSRSSGCDAIGASGYSLQAAQANVVAGQTYLFYMATSTQYAQGGAAWADWDKDGAFEPHEQIVSGYWGQTGAVYANLGYTVPAYAINGATRLRVRCMFASDPSNQPCAYSTYGEVEDYIVNVTGGVSGNTYAWTPAGSLVSSTVANPMTTLLGASQTFNVSVTDPTGCTSTGSVGVTVNAPPVINAVTATPPVLCAGANSQLLVDVAGVSPICTAGQSLGSCAFDEYITNVTFGSIVSNSGCSLPTGYQDLTSQYNVVAAGAVGLPLFISFGPFFPGDQLRVWIDWDQNGVFTNAGEEYDPGALSGTAGAPATFFFSVNVPPTAVNGPTRMRVRLTYSGAIPSCGITTYGETEDYTVIVTGGTPPMTYLWTPLTLLNSAYVRDPLASNINSATVFSVTVTGGNGCAAQGSVSVTLDPTDTDSDGLPDCQDDCPLVYGVIGYSCDDGNPNTMFDVLDAACQCVGTPAIVALQAKVVLEGPYNPTTGLMLDNLRVLPSFPLAHPYGGAPYTYWGTETVAQEVLNVTGSNAIVDWVLIEVRNSAFAPMVLDARAALLQRDGDVVHTDGFSPVLFSLVNGSYYVSVRHRNHLGIMTAAPITMSGAGTTLDLTISGTPTYGTDARKSITGTFPTLAMWAGDVTANGQVKYTGGANDRDPVLTAIGGTTPTNTVSGYLPSDVTMDGTVKYTGSLNDRDPILLNIGGSAPTNIRNGQLP